MMSIMASPRRSWARNKEAIFAIEREMQRTPNLESDCTEARR